VQIDLPANGCDDEASDVHFGEVQPPRIVDRITRWLLVINIDVEEPSRNHCYDSDLKHKHETEADVST
jgi:hypothetical protein